MRKKIQHWLTLLIVGVLLIAGLPLTAQAADTPTITVDKEALNNSLETPGVFRVGMEANYRPYNWSQPDDSDGAVPIANADGEYANGYDVQVAKMIADALGVKLEVYKIEWDGLPPALVSGKIDAIIAGMSPTPEREEQIDFSDTYYTSDIVLVTTKDSPYADAKTMNNFQGARVTAQLNTLHYDLIDQLKGVDKQTAMEDFPAMISAVSAGKIDAYMAERPGAMANITSNPNLKMIAFPDGQAFDLGDTSPDTAVGVRKNSELTGMINQVLADFTPEDQDNIMQEMVDLEAASENQGFWQQVWDIATKYRWQFLRGTVNTMLIALVSTTLGFLLGLIIAIYRSIPLSKHTNPFLRFLYGIGHFLMSCYIEIFRGTPMMVQALLIFYGSKLFFNIDMAAMVAAFFIVSINTGAYLSEVIRGGIEGIDNGQYEGAKAIGMTHAQTMIHVVLPQAIKNILPAIGNEFVINIKDTSVLNVIAVSELFFVTKSAAGATYLTFQTYFIACAIYFVLTFTTTRLLRLLEKKMQGSVNYAMTSSTQPE